MTADPLPDDELSPRPTEFILENARAGNDAAWKELYERYQRMLVIEVECRMPGSLFRRFDGEDVLQNAFAKVHDQITSFEYVEEGSFRAWLRTIVLNEFKNLVKAQARERRRISREEESVEPGQDPLSLSPNPSQALHDVETKQNLVEAMAQLDDEHREVITMRAFEDMTWEAIGGILGCGPDAAKRRFNRAVQLLTRHMK